MASRVDRSIGALAAGWRALPDPVRVEMVGAIARAADALRAVSPPAELRDQLKEAAMLAAVETVVAGNWPKVRAAIALHFPEFAPLLTLVDAAIG